MTREQAQQKPFVSYSDGTEGRVIRTDDYGFTVDSVYKAAEKLINLGQNPSPGSVTWHEAMKSAYNDLVESVIDSENVDISIDPEEI